MSGVEASFRLMDSRQLALQCRDLADNKKAEDLVILDMRKVSSVADYFLICTGSSEPHLRAVVDEITEKLREEHGLRPRAIDGALRTGWVVLDYFDVLIHVMRADRRDRYDLEGLWGDAARLKPRPPRTRRKKAGTAGSPPAAA